MEQLKKIPKLLLALLIQILALGLLALGVIALSYIISPPYPFWALVLVQGVLAAFLSCRLGLPCWWRYIQFFIPVGLYWALQVTFSPLWALGLFVLIFLTFSNTFKERVPLYLTNSTTREALKKLTRKSRQVRFLDLGSGLGGNVSYMSQLKNIEASDGVETAPIPYLLSKLFSFFRGGRIFAMDIWKTDLSYYDVVYAFLSTEPMSKLWQKVQDEMQPGSVFVSNSFQVPDIEPTEIWELADSRQTKLFIYRIE